MVLTHEERNGENVFDADEIARQSKTSGRAPTTLYYRNEFDGADVDGPGRYTS
jgi:hypothetical protein